MTRSQGKRRLRLNREPRGCSNTRLRISSRTSSAVSRWSSMVPSHFDFGLKKPLGSRSPARDFCHHVFGLVVDRSCRSLRVTSPHPSLVREAPNLLSSRQLLSASRFNGGGLTLCP